MVHIFVRTNNSRSKPRFETHYNRELGKKYYSEREYRSDLKSRGLEQYDPSKVAKVKDPKYKPSKWSREMVNEVKATRGKPGGRFYDQLSKKGYTPDKLKKMNEQSKKMAQKGNQEGGFE